MAKRLLTDELAERLHGKAVDRTFPLLLPREHDLAASEGVPRHTVRAVLAKLGSGRLVDRRPHVGTRVISQDRGGSFDREPGSLPDLNGLAAQNPREIPDVREFVAGREFASRIHRPTGETFIRFSMASLERKTGDPPVARTCEYADRSFIDPAFERGAARSFTSQGPSTAGNARRRGNGARRRRSRRKRPRSSRPGKAPHGNPWRNATHHGLIPPGGPLRLFDKRRAARGGDARGRAARRKNRQTALESGQVLKRETTRCSA